MTESIEKIEKIKKDIEPNLLKIPGVRGLGIGRKTVAGQKQDELSITVYVTSKKKEDDIPDNELIPKEKNGVKIDVIELNPTPKTDSQAGVNIDRNRSDSLIGGLNVGTLVETGTLGAICIANNTGEFLMLSSAHVLSPSSNSSPGDPICNPAEDQTHVVGTLKAGKIGGFIDAAVATVNNPNNIRCAIADIGTVTGFVDDNELPNMIGRHVKKRGIRTGITSGTIELINSSTLTIDYQHGIGPKDLVNQIIIKPDSGDSFSDEGDSGSCILDDSNKVVGLLLGGDTIKQNDGLRYSYANHIRPILNEFNISICSQQQ